MTSTILATDPRITYSSHWDQDGHSGSVKYTNNQGATAELTFEGTNVQVLGTLPGQQKSQIPRSSYSIDNGAASVYTVQNLGKSPSPNQVFFQSDPRLESANHTLVITSLADNAFLILSAITFSTSLSSSNSSTQPPSDTLQPSDTTTPTASLAASSTPSNTSQSQALGSSGEKVSVGGIVGGLLAALIVLAALILFFLHRRRKQQRKSRPMVTPFLAPSTTGTPMRSPMYPQERYISPTVGQANFDDIPPSFVAGPSRNAARHGSMYKPRNSIDSLPPSEYGYGAGA